MLRRPPGERLDRERGVPRAAGSHHRCAEDAEIRSFVREAPPIHHVRLGAVAHASSAVCVRAKTGPVRRGLYYVDGAGGAEPLFHLVLRELNCPYFILS